jgi:hypothetical protein
VYELDRILDRDDVPFPLRVDLVDHRGECRRLSGASGSGDEDQPAGFLGQPRDDGRQPQILETEDLEGDRADRHRHASALTEDVPSKARELRNGEREVEPPTLMCRSEAPLEIISSSSARMPTLGVCSMARRSL